MLQMRRMALNRQNQANIPQRSSQAELDSKPGEAVEMTCAFLSQVAKGSTPLAISAPKTDTTPLSLFGLETALLESEDYTKPHPTGPVALPTVNPKADRTVHQVVAPENPTVLVVLRARKLPCMLPTAHGMTMPRDDAGEAILPSIHRQHFQQGKCDAPFHQAAYVVTTRQMRSLGAEAQMQAANDYCAREKDTPTAWGEEWITLETARQAQA
jgi:hypothetical protein